MTISIQDGRAWCVAMHGQQMYGPGEPYAVHLDDVAAVLQEFGVATYHNILKAYAHDLFEDVPGLTPLHMMTAGFPIAVTRGACRLKDPRADSRDESKRLLYIQLANHYEDILVKLADRLSNWRRGKKSCMYHREYVAFRKGLYNPRHRRAKGMWAALDAIYSQGFKLEAIAA